MITIERDTVEEIIRVGRGLVADVLSVAGSERRPERRKLALELRVLLDEAHSQVDDDNG